jgi:acyl carrier protein
MAEPGRPAPRPEDIADTVVSIAGSLLKLAPAERTGLLDRDLADIGINSLSLFWIRDEIAGEIGIELDVERLFDATTLHDVVDAVVAADRPPTG